MALFEQICRHLDDGTPHNSDFGPNRLDVNINRFVQAVRLVIFGMGETVSSLRTKLGLSNVVDASGLSDFQDLDNWVAAGNNFAGQGGNAETQRQRRNEWLMRTEAAVFMQNESDWPGVTTPNDVRALLNMPLATYGA